MIVGAKVQLTNELTQQVREFLTDSNGNFTFTNVPPGNYTLRVAHPGFKTYEQKAINVGAVEKVALPEIVLQVGDVSTSVEVQASAVRVATDSSDRGVAITTRQIEDTVTKGRNFMMLMSTLPGVQDLNQNDSRGWGTGSPTLMGGQSGQKLLVLDGAASQDSGNRDFGYIAPSVDAIAEVRVLIANFNAEYGARSGGQMNVMVKSGSTDFHGSGYYFIRNDAFNANEFFNNKTGVPRPRYKYHNLGGTIGGPFIIPGTNFNKSHNKLFWFFSYDYLRTKNVTGANRYTMPTALERAGDFSTDHHHDRRADPDQGSTHAGAPFPGNKIPAEPDRPHGRGDDESLPAAEHRRSDRPAAVQRRVRQPVRAAAARPHFARRLSDQFQGDRLCPPAAGLHGQRRLRTDPRRAWVTAGGSSRTGTTSRRRARWRR